MKTTGKIRQITGRESCAVQRTAFSAFFFAGNEPKSVPARDFDDCCENYEELTKRVSHS